MRPLLPLIVAVAAASPLAAAVDPQLQQLLAQSAKAPVVGFERTTRAEVRADPKKEPALVVDRFAPRSAETGSWTVVSVDGRKPTPQEVEAHAKGNSNPPGFHNLHKLLSLPPTSRREADGKTIFLWNSLPKGSVVTPGGDISSGISAEATLEGGRLSELHLFARKPIRVKVIASVDRFDVLSRYQTGANGLPFLTSQTNETDVTAPMGYGGKRRSVASFQPL